MQMKNNMLKFTMLLFMAALTMLACKKKEGCTDPAAPNYDAEAKKSCKDCCDDHIHGTPVQDTASINLTSPTAGATYGNADTVYITASITRSKEMHGYEYTLKKVSDQSVVTSGSNQSHSKSYSINSYWVNNLTAHTEMELILTVFLDHDHSTDQIVKRTIHCNP